MNTASALSAGPDLGTSYSAFVVDDLRTLEATWRKLERSGVCSPYQRFDWVVSYAEALGDKQGSASALVVQDASRTPLLLLPLSVEVSFGLRVATPLGGKQANYHSPVMARGAGDNIDPDTMRSLLCTVGRESGFDVYALLNLPLAWNGERNPLVLPNARPSPSFAPKTDLSGDVDALLNRAGTSESRRKLRKKKARLDAQGELVFCSADNVEQVDSILAAFFDQKNERFRELSIRDPFADERVRRFIRQACLSGLREGQPAIALHGLFLDGRCIATYGGAVDAHRYSCMFNSFEQAPDVARSSPGDLLLSYVIRTQGKAGRTTFDLGVGEARYKRLFCDDDEELVDVFVPVTSAGRAYAYGQTRVLAAKAYIKQNPSLWQAAQRFRSLVRGSAQRSAE